MNPVLMTATTWLLMFAPGPKSPGWPGPPAAPGEPAWGDRAQLVFENWQNTSDIFPVRTLLVILGLFFAIMLGVWFRQWYKNRPTDPTPNHLFRTMARELRLGLLDQWLLLRIAREQQLVSPLTLLLSRATMHHYAQQYAQHLSAFRAPMVLGRAQRIIDTIFGSPAQAQKDTLLALKQANFQVVVASDGVARASQSESTPVVAQPVSATEKPPAGVVR